jgi:chitodextrinase
MPIRLVVAGLVAGAVMLFASPASAIVKPTIRVTAKTESTISVAWTASSGAARYDATIWENSPTVVSLPGTQTSHTFTGLRPNGQYYVSVTAVDSRGRKATSNLLVVVTLPDRVAPSTPANVRVTDVTPSKVSLAWDASTDNAGIAEYLLSVSPFKGRTIFTGPTSLDLIALPPDTTFTLAVRARDFGWNFSPFSVPVTATTEASTDVTPPTVPTNLRVGNVDWCGEVKATWTQSTDDQDPQAAIRYQFRINDQPDPFGDEIGVGRHITYGLVEGANTYVVRAIDSAGNASAFSVPYTLDVHLCA